MPEIFSVPTTLEMDGLIKQEDIDNRHFIMGQCLECSEWCQWDTRVGEWQCSACGGKKYNLREARSIRTWATTKDTKTTKKTQRGTNA